MKKEEITKQIEETEIKLKQLREALSEPEYKPSEGDILDVGENGLAMVLPEDRILGINKSGKTVFYRALRATEEIGSLYFKGFLGTFNEVFIRRDDVAKDYVLKADVLALTDFNDDSLASCIDKGFVFEGCVCLHKQLTDLID